MARHENNGSQAGGGQPTPEEKRARLDEQASRASALLAGRNAARAAGGASLDDLQSAEQKRQRLIQAQPAREAQGRSGSASPAGQGARTGQEPQVGQGVRTDQGSRAQQGARDSQGSRGNQSARAGRSARGGKGAQAQRASHSREARQVNPRSMGEFLRRNIVYIASAVFAIVLATGGIFAVRAYLSAGSADQGAEPAGYTSPYDWDKLENVDGRYRYVVDGQVKSRTGIDVSSYQEAIDWNAVAADGIDFAYIRVGYRGVTEGGMYLDDWYWENIAGAKAAGIDCGAYFFSQAISVEEAVEEADFTLSYLEGIELECPIVFDAEIYLPKTGTARSIDLSNDEMTAIAQAFCERVEAAGYQAMIYGNASDLGRYNADLLDRYPVWWAEYDRTHPSETLDIVMWQYSNQGAVAGINTNVDMSVDLSGVL